MSRYFILFDVILNGIVSYVICPGSMHNTGCLGLVHRDNPERYGREVGGEFRSGNLCTPVADSC